VIVGNQNITLPCENLAELMNVSAMTISRYRNWAVKDGYLRRVKEHKFSSRGQGNATEFRFDVSRWRCLDEKAQQGTASGFQGSE
jgi:hypothetical protein